MYEPEPVLRYRIVYYAMVGLPYSSAGCVNCRKRKIKVSQPLDIGLHTEKTLTTLFSVTCRSQYAPNA